MDIVIENCSSAGAHFSENTNEVLRKIYHWIIDNNAPKLKFKELRDLLKNTGINDNNARNIYPLMKNSGFMDYSTEEAFDTSEFFTPKGKAYILILETLLLIEHADSNNNCKAAIQSLNNILIELIYDGVQIIINNNEAQYAKSLCWFLKFLLEYRKINKYEFAYMVYLMNHDPDNWQLVSKPVIEQYRNGLIDINVKVKVRNDNRLQETTGTSTRLGEISLFTAYSYYSPLLMQAGIIFKERDYYCLKDKKKIEVLLGATNG